MFIYPAMNVLGGEDLHKKSYLTTGMNTDDTDQERPKPLKHGGTEVAEKSKFTADCADER